MGAGKPQLSVRALTDKIWRVNFTFRACSFLKSGSSCTSGRCYAQLTRVGNESYASRLAAQAKSNVEASKSEMMLSLDKLIKFIGIALILALLVDTIRVGAQFFRTVYFFPIVISATALGLMFNLIFLYKGGMVNQLLLCFT